ncbi:MAG: hypothetical protein LBE16_01215 [Clostridiales Family XIII bacterium]|jgi:hypothetical protein|nr:hypothetical protein [Clostridiales Family XIII bacterium]
MRGRVRRGVSQYERAGGREGGRDRPFRRGAAALSPRRVRLRSKRGATMVEAAVVFPLVIASVAALIYLMINLYSFTALRASLHIALRAEADAETGLTEALIADGRVYDRYRLAAERRGISAEHHREAVIRPYVAAEESKRYTGNAMIAGGVTRTHFGRFYVLDEVGIVRNLALARAVTGSEGENET